MTHPHTIAIERLRTARDRLQKMLLVDRTIEDPFERLVAQNVLNSTYELLRSSGLTIEKLDDQAEVVWKTIAAYTPKETAHA